MKLFNKINFINCVIFTSVVGVCSLSLTGCGKKNEKVNINTLNNKPSVDDQLAVPKPGEKIAVFYIKDYGTFKCKLFEKLAPNTVKSFIDLVNLGKFNNIEFDEVIPDLLIKAGENVENFNLKNLKPEPNLSLHHYNGAVCVNFDEDLENGFCIICSEDGKRTDFDYLQSDVSDENKPLFKNYKFEENVRNIYRDVGGFPFFDMMSSHTIFGQVFEGMETILKIVTSEDMTNTDDMVNEEDLLNTTCLDYETDNEEESKLNKPAIIIEKIEIETQN